MAPMTISFSASILSGPESRDSPGISFLTAGDESFTKPSASSAFSLSDNCCNFFLNQFFIFQLFYACIFKNTRLLSTVLKYPQPVALQIPNYLFPLFV